MKLFAVYLGGYIDGGHVEIHDIRFVVGEKIEDTYKQLQKEWIGGPEFFHIDAYIEIKKIDGYNITISREKSLLKEKLYFIFMGAYDKDLFGELHEVAFFVGQDDVSIKERALTELCSGAEGVHRDTLYDIDNIVEISSLGDYFVNLKYTGEKNQSMAPDWFGFNTDVGIK